MDAVKGCLLAAVGFSVAPPTTFFFLRAALGAAILDLGCPGTLCTVGCLSVGLELLLAMVVMRREAGCFSSAGGLLNPFLAERLGMDFGFVSRELGACSLEEAPGACNDISITDSLEKFHKLLLLRELLLILKGVEMA